MDYRRRENCDSDLDSDHDDLPLNAGESNDAGEDFSEDNGPVAKRAARLWSDALMEQNLLHSGSVIALEKPREGHVKRGVESYHVPVCARTKQLASSSGSVQCERTSASAGDPFDDCTIDLRAEIAFCERLSEGSSITVRNNTVKKGYTPSIRGRGPQGRTRDNVRGGLRGRHTTSGVKRSWQGKVTGRDELLSPSYSLETLMAVEFDTNISIEQLSDEIAKAMGERDPRTVQRIVHACGMDKAISLFEETRKVESSGGMMIDNGERRRTPGGVFISLFKLDPDIPEDVKKQVFGETRRETRRLIRARRKGRFNFAEDVAKLAELMKINKENASMGNPLKPLPEVETPFQQNSLVEDDNNLQQDFMVEEDKRVSESGKVEEARMEL